MWSERRFSNAIDRYVQGLDDPNAPFNQDSGLPPICDKCEREGSGDHCLYPCPELDEYMSNRETTLENNAHYMAWLGEHTEETVLELHECALMDWIGLDTFSKEFHIYRLDAEDYLNAV